MDLEKIIGDIIYPVIKHEKKITREMITPEKSLIDDLGADSLGLFEIVLAVEKEFNLSIDIYEVRDKLITVQNIIDFLKEELQEKVSDIQ
jgi:acyl carrier protein